MTNNQNTNKEALFNEVKGSLFEFLVAKVFAQKSRAELDFVKSIDPNYLHVLSQQDRMVRQFYPELGSFLKNLSEKTATEFISYLKEIPRTPKLYGKFTNSDLSESLHETDITVETSQGPKNISLKLNKKSSFVNTKSAGIKSFFVTYFPFLSPSLQEQFNHFVDQAFVEMSFEIHQINGWDYSGNYQDWVKFGKSELPGELSDEERDILKKYYAKISSRIFDVFTNALNENREEFILALPRLMGFGHADIIQLVCLHDFKNETESLIQIHTYQDVENHLKDVKLRDFQQTSSVEFNLGPWDLQIRVKPMNKFTTTAMKINCAIRFRQSSKD